MISYEERLNQNLNWGFEDASRHFENESSVHKTLRRVARKLGEIDVPYAVVGAMAMFFHGYRRFTEDVDLLVTRRGRAILEERLREPEFSTPTKADPCFRDMETGVRIDLIVTGRFPGDGKPKPVAFPDPVECRQLIDGLYFLQLPKLIEMNLAYGMCPGRLKGHADVQEMIAKLKLPEEIVEHLHPSVQKKYRELWVSVRDDPWDPAEDRFE